MAPIKQSLSAAALFKQKRAFNRCFYSTRKLNDAGNILQTREPATTIK